MLYIICRKENNKTSWQSYEKKNNGQVMFVNNKDSASKFQKDDAEAWLSSHRKINNFADGTQRQTLSGDFWIEPA